MGRFARVHGPRQKFVGYLGEHLGCVDVDGRRRIDRPGLEHEQKKEGEERETPIGHHCNLIG